MQKTLVWISMLGAICAAGFALWAQHRIEVDLCRDLADLRVRNNALQQQRNENRRLAAALPGADELARLRADHGAIPRLRAEIEAMHSRLQAAAQQAQVSARFSDGSRIAATDWRDAGTATARSTLETVLWAAAGGDIDTFAQCLLLPDGRARQRAIALLESLPEGVREQYGTPERLIAFLATKDVPVGTAEVVGWDEIHARTSPAQLQVQMQLTAPDAQPKDLILQFAQVGSDWKLLVPEAAIAKYSAILKGRLATGPIVTAPSGGIRIGNK